MASTGCEHVSWLYLTGGRSAPCLRYEGRYERVIREMTNPSAQFPSLVFFMGSKTKDAALPKLFPRNNLRRRCVKTEAVNLRVDNSTLESARPILFADCDPTLTELAHHNGSRADCHTHENHSIAWIDETKKHQLLDLLIARLFLWFTDVICIFADDVGGLEGVKALLLSWATIGSAAKTTFTVRPRVLVVTLKHELSTAHDWLSNDNLLLDLGVDLEQTFAKIEITSLSEDGLLRHAQYQRLHQEIIEHVDLTQKARSANSTLISAVHQNALFALALRHTARTIHEPFDHILAARAGNELSCEFRSHLENFLKLCQENKVPDDATVSYIASSILMDAFPPGSAGKGVYLLHSRHR